MNVFVTGGSRGIGRAIATRFARDGAKRIAIGYLRNDRAAEETAEDLRTLGTEITPGPGETWRTKLLRALDAIRHPRTPAARRSTPPAR